MLNIKYTISKIEVSAQWIDDSSFYQYNNNIFYVIKYKKMTWIIKQAPRGHYR